MEKKAINWEVLALARFLLALTVFAGHLSLHTDIGPFIWYSYLGPFEAILGFLLISGLSIGKSYQSKPQAYFKRRIQRIYPIYAASIVLVYVLDPQTITPVFLLILLINFLFLNQILTTGSFVGPAWTLALEVWLYFLTPWLIRLSIKRLMTIVYISFATYCIYTCGRTLFNWKHYSGVSMGINLLLLSFIWVAGLVWSRPDKNEKLVRYTVAGFFVVHWVMLTGIQLVYRIRHHELQLFLQTDLVEFLIRCITLTLVFYVVLYNHRIPSPSLAFKKLFSFLGNISYPLYLIHLSIISFLIEKKVTNWLVITAIVLLASSLFYLLFDSYSKKRKIT